MGKKKKGGNKLARMSEEERARYLQHRADIEEEARRRKEQLISLYMKNKLKREDAFTRLNLAKINQEWRSILRQLKCQELKEELKSVQQFCTEALERKNAAIRRLLCDLDESEELYATMLHSHMENIQRLINLHADRLKFWHHWYLTEKQSMLDRFHTQMKKYKVKKFQAYDDLECIYHALREEVRLDEKKDENDHIRKTDDLKNTMTIRLEEVTRERELEMENLWRQFQNVLNNYLTHTQEFHSEYLELKQCDEEDTKNIQQHYVEVAKSTEVITELKIQLTIAREDHIFTVTHLRKYKGQLQKKYDEVKWKLNTGIKDDKSKLTDLVTRSSGAIKFLQRMSKKGTVLLQMASLCEKLETEQDKITFHQPRRCFEVTQEELQEPPAVFGETPYDIFSKMENFWIRYNRTRIDNVCLQEERNNLQRENKRLKLQIRDYLVSVTMMSGNGIKPTRLIDRPSSMKVEKIVHIDLAKIKSGVKIKRRPVTCIEGNLSVAVRSHQMLQSKFKPPIIFSTVNRI